MSDKGSVNNRLDQSVNGGAKINPDEQRKYLGTYRERVDLVIKIADLNKQKSIQDFQEEIKKVTNYQLLLNGRIDHELIAPYMRIAAQNNIKFSIKSDSFYNNDEDSYGLVYTADKAINQSPIEINKKYPEKNQNEQKDNQQSNPKNNNQHESLWTKFKNLF